MTGPAPVSARSVTARAAEVGTGERVDVGEDVTQHVPDRLKLCAGRRRHDGIVDGVVAAIVGVIRGVKAELPAQQPDFLREAGDDPVPFGVCVARGDVCAGGALAGNVEVLTDDAVNLLGVGEPAPELGEVRATVGVGLPGFVALGLDLEDELIEPADVGCLLAVGAVPELKLLLGVVELIGKCVGGPGVDAVPDGPVRTRVGVMGQYLSVHSLPA